METPNKTEKIGIANAIQLLAQQIKSLTPRAKIPGKFAQQLVEQLEDFKNKYVTTEILDVYEFQPESQEFFYNQVKQSTQQIVTLHLGLVPENFQDDALSLKKPHLQYFFEFDNNGKYFVLLKTAKPISVTPVEFLQYTSDYKASNLYKNLNDYISNNTGGMLNENTKKIIIKDIPTKKNEIYNLIEKNKNQGTQLKTMYAYPMIQVLDFYADELLENVLQSLQQLYSFGMLISTHADLDDPNAIIDDRHRQCPPLC
jgi:type II secretory pathway component GspD/PulD (secretin)